MDRYRALRIKKEHKTKPIGPKLRVASTFSKGSCARRQFDDALRQFQQGILTNASNPNIRVKTIEQARAIGYYRAYLNCNVTTEHFNQRTGQVRSVRLKQITPPHTIDRGLEDYRNGQYTLRHHENKYFTPLAYNYR